MIRTIKDRKELAYYLQAIDIKDLIFSAYWSKDVNKSKFYKAKIKSTYKHKKYLLVYYYITELKASYLSAIADISNVEVYKPQKLYSGGQPK